MSAFLSLTELGQLYGVSRNMVGQWLVDLGLRTKEKKPSRAAFDGGFERRCCERKTSGLVAAGEADSAAARCGVGWLIEQQLEDGGWDEPYFTGTGFPGDFYLNYHIYRDVFPVMALGRLLEERR